MNQSSISIKLNGVEISDRVVYSQTTFTSQANPMQGTFTVTVRDPNNDFVPVCGQTLTCHIDGVPLFGGFVMRVGRGNFFPAVDTAAPVKTRKWVLMGPDFNFLFDKRIIYDPTDFTAGLNVPSDKRTITKAIRYLYNNFVDVPDQMDWWTYVDTIYDDETNAEALYGGSKGASFLQQGSLLRAQMDDFADQSGLIYYIDADYKLHVHAYESVVTPWTIVDVQGGSGTVRFRDGEYTEDFTSVVTEAHVWGGSAYKTQDGGTGGDVVYKKYPDYPINNAREQKAMDRISEFGRWQYGEERVGQMNYLTMDSVRKRARVIINGPTGAPPTYGIESGMSRPLRTMTCTWFAHDVPGKVHVRPGYLQDFILYSQGPPTPLIFRLPLRSMTISFPTLPTDNPGGETYVQFEGEFGVAYSDSRFLWTFLKKNRRGPTGSSIATGIVDNNTTSASLGSLAMVSPVEETNGTRRLFTFPYTFFRDQMTLYINGLYQRNGLDYTYDADTGQVRFVTAPKASDKLWAVGYVS